MSLIIDNGTLQVISTMGGGMVAGRPVPTTDTPGEPIPCNIKTNTSDRHGRAVDGVFKRTDYIVLIDTDAAQTFKAERVVLTDNRGQRMGTFRVQDIQHLDYVGAIQIALSHAD